MSIDPALAAYGITVEHIPAGAAVTIVPIEGRLRELRITLVNGVVLKAELSRLAMESAASPSPVA